MKKHLRVLVVFTCLYGCNSNSEFELKRNYSYTLTKQEILTHRVFTANGEITNRNKVASIFQRVELLNPLRAGFPESTNDFDFDFSISFLDQEAVFNRDNNLDTFKIKSTGKFIRLQSDTLQFIVSGTYDENKIDNNIGKYSINILAKESVPMLSGFGEKLTYRYELFVRPGADKLIMPRLFFYHFNSNYFPLGSILTAEINNEINPDIHQYLNQGDTLLVNEINWVLE